MFGIPNKQQQQKKKFGIILPQKNVAWFLNQAFYQGINGKATAGWDFPAKEWSWESSLQ